MTVGERPVVRGATVGTVLCEALHASAGFRESAAVVASAGDDVAQRLGTAVDRCQHYPAALRTIVASLMDLAALAPNWETALLQMVVAWGRPASVAPVDPRVAYRFRTTNVEAWRDGAAHLAARGSRQCVATDCDAPAAKVTSSVERDGYEGFKRETAGSYCSAHDATVDGRAKAHARKRARLTAEAAVAAWPTPEELALLRYVLGRTAA